MAPRENLTFVIADDHQIFRNALKAILEENRFAVVGEAADGNQAVQLCESLEPDIVVLDVSMPRLNGIDAARKIKEVHPDTKIILLTIHAETQYIVRSLRAGVSAYITKTKADSSLLEAVYAVCRGETYVRAAGSHRPYDEVQI